MIAIGMPVFASEPMTPKEVSAGIDPTGAPFHRHSDAPVVAVPFSLGRCSWTGETMLATMASSASITDGA